MFICVAVDGEVDDVGRDVGGRLHQKGVFAELDELTVVGVVVEFTNAFGNQRRDADLRSLVRMVMAVLLLGSGCVGEVVFTISFFSMFGELLTCAGDGASFEGTIGIGMFHELTLSGKWSLERGTGMSGWDIGIYDGREIEKWCG